MFVAQTNLQLYKQLREHGFLKEDLRFIHRAYHFGVQLFPFLYRPNGKEHLAHGVGTASILCSVQKKNSLIAAGLLHATYRHGEFPSLRTGPTKSNRTFVQDALGRETEEHIVRYFHFDWDKQNLEELLSRFENLRPEDRDSLLIRLADCLEKCIDLGVLYSSPGKGPIQSLQKKGPIQVELARRLGYPSLANQLQIAQEAIFNSKIPSCLRKTNGAREDFTLVPLSARRKIVWWAFHRFFS